jgi:hypothetical protein
MQNTWKKFVSNLNNTITQNVHLVDPYWVIMDPVRAVIWITHFILLFMFECRFKSRT